MIILGIDTSCDDTSCAIVQDGKTVISNVISSQVDLHAKYGGVVPEIASRRHLEMMVPVTREALSRAGMTLKEVDAVAATTGPGLMGSLLVGLCFGKSLAAGLGLPFIGVHHLEGHMYANFLREDPPPFPSLNLVVSGGHSDLILMRSHGQYEVLGETRDDAAGEIFDKVARELGLPFPGGPHLDRVAEEGDPEAFRFAHPKMEGNQLDFSFSGMKTHALQVFRANPGSVADICASLRKAVVRDLLYNVPHLAEVTHAKSLALSGGVAANSLLRKEAMALSRRLGIPLFIPEKVLCTDNGAMIAAAGFRRLLKGETSGPDVSADAGLTLESWGEDGR